MKKNHDRPVSGRPGLDDRLRTVLRAGDPAADGREPTPYESVGWKRRILADVPAPIASWRRLIGWAAAATAIAVIVLLVLPLRRDDRETRTGTASDGTDPGPGMEAGRMAHDSTATRSAKRNSRTIQFRAPNGTRIIWTLNPDLSLDGTDSRQRIEGETS
jgi:hypothetical protein